MAGLEEALRIPEDNDGAEDAVRREGKPQEGPPADGPAGHLRRALRTREELQFLQGQRRKDGAEPAEEGLPCGRQPEEGRDGRDGIQLRVGQGLPLSGDRLPQRRDTRLCAVAEPEHGSDRVHAVRPLRKASADLQHDPEFGPGVAVPDAGIPGVAEGTRDHTVDVEEGQLPRQRQDGELLLQAEEGDVLRNRVG